LPPLFIKFLSVFTILYVIVLITTVLYHILFKRKIVDKYLRLPLERKAKILEANIKLENQFKLLLFLSPLYLIAPIVWYFYFRESSIYVTVIFYLTFASTLYIYVYIKWFIDQIRNPEKLHTNRTEDNTD